MYIIKTNITLILLLNFSICFSQKAEHNNLDKKASFKEYITKNGDVLKVGDTLIIGIPTSDLGFTYISQGGKRVSNTLSDKKILIDKLKTYGTKNSGYKMYVHFKGYGLLPVLIDYDTAFELGEIKNPNAKLTRLQAIEKLKEAKELLDLGVISEEEYTEIKTKLSLIILK